MVAASTANFDTLITKLNRLQSLSAGDRAAIRALPTQVSVHSPGHALVREGDRPTQCCLLLSGYACRYKMASGGGRQIVSFHMAGDILDVQHIMLEQADHSVMALTEVTVAWIAADVIEALVQTHPAINIALWRDALIDASIFREWVLNIGRRDAKSRVAHMLCEFAARREAAGLGSADHFELPMSQEVIADATGLTTVHVNRMLQSLAEDGVISRNRRHVRIVDGQQMRRVADFDPAYLHEAA